jgi:hypothetical protein
MNAQIQGHILEDTSTVYNKHLNVAAFTAKGTVQPLTCHADLQGSKGIVFHLASALEGGTWSTPRPGRITPKKETRYPLYRTLGGTQSWSGRLRKISPAPGFDSRTEQAVASRCTDWAIQVHALTLALPNDCSFVFCHYVLSTRESETACMMTWWR